MAFQHDFGMGQPAPPGLNGTDPRIPYGSTVFNTNALPPFTPLTETRFEAIHAALIPKGPHRGKVLVWNEQPIYSVPPTSMDPTGQMWSFQQWSIVDPSLVVPITQPRFRNFFLPIAPVVFQVNPITNQTEALGANIFCSGHVWTPEGDLVVVGGTTWNGGAQSGALLTFVFDPNQLSAPFPANGATAPLYSSGGSPEVGMWLRGPDLSHSRYYPTALLTHVVPRTEVPSSIPGNPPIRPMVATVVVLGGDVTEPKPPMDLQVGVTANWTTWNSYEALRIDAAPRHPQTALGGSSGVSKDSVNNANASFTFDGPGTPLPSTPTQSQIMAAIPVDWMWFYPRTHLRSDGAIIVSGFTPKSRVLNHDAVPTVGAAAGGSNWFPQTNLPGISLAPSPQGPNWFDMRTYGASVRMPNVFGNSDTIIRIGGAPFMTLNMSIVHSTHTVEACDFSAAAPQWTNIDPMPSARAVLNAVLLPDATIAVFGGASYLAPQPDGSILLNPVYQPAIYTIGSGWALQPAAQSPRTYHSTAILLPDGRVLVAGSDDRTVDYELFEPAYLSAGQRPTSVVFSDLGGNPLDEVGRAPEYSVITCDSLPFGVFIEKVVLMAPGATTHHSDMCQRYYQLSVDPIGPDKVHVKIPESDRELPSGHYMCFAVTNQGVPSEAIWIKLLPN